MNIKTVTPEKWLIIKINHNNKEYYKVFGTWAGGYLDGDSWRINSGIKIVKQDGEYYQFIGVSGSCYRCHKKSYGVATTYGFNIVNSIVNNAKGVAIIMEDKEDWCNLNETIKEENYEI